MWVYSDKFLNGLLSGYAFFCLDMDDFFFSFEYWAGLSQHSKTLVFACSPGISMNLGDSFF